MKNFCEINGILLTAYGPLGSPYRDNGLVLLDDPIVKQIANKHKKTNAQILIKFQVNDSFNLLNDYFCLTFNHYLKQLDSTRLFSYT